MKTLFCQLLTVLLYLHSPAQKSALSSFGTLPMQNGFLKNVGQVKDVNNKNVNFVYYEANLGDQQVFITSYGLSLVLARAKKILKTSCIDRHIKPYKQLASDSLFTVDYELERTDIVLSNASIVPEKIITKTEERSPLFNFNISSIATLSQSQMIQNEILIRDVYPGIDWKIYINKSDDNHSFLKYDFIVHPGADPSSINLKYSGNAKVNLTDNEIIANTKMGSIHEKKPYAYLVENKEQVSAEYSLKNNSIHFATGSYDKTKTLVIDPTIFWLTYITSTSHINGYQSIIGNDVETDASGNIFVQLSVAGGTPFPTVNPGGGAYYQDITATPNGSMLLIKFAPGGQILWSTYFGNIVAGRCMTIDKNGNIVVIGISTAANSSIPLLNNGGYYDSSPKQYFISKFSNNGVLLWSSYYANFSTYPSDMSYDINGNIYVTGWSTINDFPLADPGGGAYITNPPKYGYAQVLFISQFDTNCHLTWSTRLEGNDYDPYARVCTDRLGNIYICGQTRSNNYPLVDAGGYFNTVNYGSVITRFNPARQMTWSTYVNGAFDITTDDSCNLYAATDKRILKFNSNTQLVFEKAISFPRLCFWDKINYDPSHDDIQLLGVMNDFYFGFPTVNTACNGSFFYDGGIPHMFNNITGPIFGTIDHDGNFTYLSLADWPYEYYDENEMTVDPHGDIIYLFGHQQDGYVTPNPQLTNPGNGAYFDNSCCYGSNGNSSALLLKLTSSELSAIAQVIPATGCSCNGTATITTQCGKAPFSYLWSNGDTTASSSGLCPGAYWVKVKDANNLSKTLSVNIPYPPGSITSLSAKVTPENCNKSNGIIAIQSVQGGISPYTYSINGKNFYSTSQFTGIDSGQYIIRVKDANGCIFYDTVLVTRIPGPRSIVFSTQKSSCTADNGRLNITGVAGGIAPYTYTLSPGSTNTTGIFTNLAAANYQLAVNDTAGCSISTTITILKATPPTDVSYTTGDDHCSMGIGFVNVNAVTGGISPYTFSVDSISFFTGIISNLTSGSYPLYVRDSNGCVLKRIPVIISMQPGPDSVDITIDHAYCGKLTGNVQINTVNGGTGPYSYSIDYGIYTPSKTFTGITPGTHTLSVKDTYGCIYSRNLEVSYIPISNITLLPSDTTICYGENLILNITGDVGSIKNIAWSIPSHGLSATVKGSGTQKIFVSIVDNNSCTIKDTSIVRVKACNTPDKCVVIPNAFSPNNDGKNEKIGPLANGCKVTNIDFKIFNRFGELIFESASLETKWDGTYKEIAQPIGVYVYMCSYITEDGVTRSQSGTITLLR